MIPEFEPLPHPDWHHLTAAEGWLELGDHRAANEELDKIAPELRGHLSVMQLRWHICARDKCWDACLGIGRAMTEIRPDVVHGWINYANALFYLKRYPEAIDLTLPLLDRFPRNPYLRHNLACYECQNGNHPAALAWLKQAFEMGNPHEMKQLALKDLDLEPLWPRIRELRFEGAE